MTVGQLDGTPKPAGGFRAAISSWFGWNKKRMAWGVDLGSSALKAIKLSVDSGGMLQIEDVAIFPYPIEEADQANSKVKPEDRKKAIVRAALATFVEKHQVKGCRVGTTVDAISSFSRFVRLSGIEPKKLSEVLAKKAAELIPVPLEKVEWTHQVFPISDSPDIQVGIFAARKSMVALNVRHFARVDVGVQVVQIGALAVYNALHHDHRLRDTTMIVDIGSEKMDLIIAEGDNLWFRSSPIGGKKLNDAIAKRFELSAVEAEAVKQKAHASEHARDVFLTLDPVFGEFVTEIKRSLGQFLAIDPQRRVMIKRVILLGETFCLPSLMQYIHNNLKTTVESVGSFSAAAPQDSDVAGLYAGHGLGLVTAYGLALQALDLTRITACLTPSRLEV